jgi:hypothetical protein
MAKRPKKKSSPLKRKRTTENEPRALRIKITKRATKDVERAIREKLESERTNLFRNSDTLIIILEEIGGINQS